MRHLARPLVISACLLVLGLSGCLGSEERSSRVKGDTLIVYSSLPATGVSAPAARAVGRGERLALSEAGGRVRGLRVRLVELNAARPGEGPWSPERVDANAERAADDPRAIAYIGELAYGASAVSVPITNEAGVLQVSPADGLTSLTRVPLGQPRAGPERYYPEDERSFVRLVPPDELQAETLLARVRATGARDVAVLYDGEIHSRELGTVLVALALRDGPDPVEAEEYRGRVDEIPDLVRDLARAAARRNVSRPGQGCGGVAWRIARARAILGGHGGSVRR